jgi:hypothetical protein
MPRPRKQDPVEALLSGVGAFLENLFAPLIDPARVLPGVRVFRCTRCGFQIGLSLNFPPPKVCPMGCGKTLEEQRSHAVPGKPGIRRMNRLEAAAFLWKHSHVRSNDHYRKPEVRREAYRKASRKLHPDNKETGNEELFKKLQEAMEVLEG